MVYSVQGIGNLFAIYKKGANLTVVAPSTELDKP